MRVAVLKLGARISKNSKSTSGGAGEALSVIKILTTAGIEVDAYTKVLDGENDSCFSLFEEPAEDDFNILNIEDHYKDVNNYDALIVINGSVNFFGGAEDKAQILNYHIINNFKGKVYYILCDPNLMLTQIWDSVSKKPWGSKYSESDIYISRKDIVYVSQPRNVDETLKIARRYVSIKDCIHFPFEKFPLLTTEAKGFNSNPKYDLLYGGTFRGGKRELDMIKFYFGLSDFKVSMFGKITKDNFTKNFNALSYPEFEKSVNYNDFTDKMSTSAATVIIGDPLYKKLDDLAQRIYESINAGNIVLIDASYDKNCIVFKDTELREFCYVNSSEDVRQRLEKLKDNNFRKHIFDAQRKDINFNKFEYCNSLKNLIENSLLN